MLLISWRSLVEVVFVLWLFSLTDAEILRRKIDRELCDLGEVGSESHFLLYRTHKEGRFLWNDWTKPWNVLVRTWRLYLNASKFVIIWFISVIIIRIHVWSVICELCRWHSVLCSHGEDRAAAPLFYVKLSVSVQSRATPCFAALNSSDHAQSVAFCSVLCYSAVSTDRSNIYMQL